MPSRTTSRLLLVLAAIVWSTSGLILKSLPGVHWLAIAGTRSVFASLVFLPGLMAPRKVPAIKLLAAATLFALVVGTLMGSMQLGTAAQGIWLHYIAPAVIALWAWLIGRQRLKSYETIAVALTAAAILVIVTGGGGSTQQTSLLLGLVSGVSFALFLLILKSLDQVPAASIHLWTNLAAAGLLLSLAVGFHVALPTAPRDLALLAGMGIGQLALGYAIFQRAIPGATAVEASLILMLEPVLNPVWVYVFLGELPSPRVLLGCGLIAVGLVIFALGPLHRQIAAVEPAE